MNRCKTTLMGAPSTRRCHRTFAVLVGALGVSLLLALSAPPAADAFACSWLRPDTLKVDLGFPGEATTFLRGPNGEVLVNGTVCATTAPPYINVYELANSTAVNIDLANGWFTYQNAGTPANTRMNVYAGYQSFTGETLNVIGSPADDSFFLQGSGGLDWISLDGDSSDEIYTDSVEILRFSMGAGNDTFSAYGDSFIPQFPVTEPLQIDAGPGNDLILGGIGDDNINGGSGVDTLTYSDTYYQSGGPWRPGGVTVDLASGTTSGALGNDVVSGIENVFGSPYSDSLTGSAGPNLLQGGYAGDDTLSGGLGNDTLVPTNNAPGDDQIDGGAGVDAVDYSGSLNGVSLDLGAGTESGEGTDTLTAVENAIGTGYADTITGSAGANTLSGRGGNDTIAGGLGDDTVVGGLGDDSLSGGGGRDTLDYSSVSGPPRTRSGETVSLAAGSATGLDGNDSLAGFERVLGTRYADSLTGSKGPDRLFGNGGIDVLDGRAGADLLDGGTGADTVDYSQEATGVLFNLATGYASTSDTLKGLENAIGSPFADSIVGTAGPNSLKGGAGNDSIQGDLGDDTLNGGAGDDSLDGGGGTDTASYADALSSVNVSLVSGSASGGDGADTLQGLENVIGSAYGDTLTGSAVAPNTLYGQSGNDTLDGGPEPGPCSGICIGAAPDNLYGGPGADTATYAGRTVPLQLTLDGVANDGAAGESDNVWGDVENVIGGTAGDVIVGNGLGNVLTGNRGSDQLDGAGGADTLNSNDLFGADSVTCGTEIDSADVDRADTVASDCESVTVH